MPGRSMSSSRTSGRSTGASARASWALAASPTNSTSGAVERLAHGRADQRVVVDQHHPQLAVDLAHAGRHSCLATFVPERHDQLDRGAAGSAPT